MPSTTSGKAVLIILDGWGIADTPDVSAIDRAKTPTFTDLKTHWPSTHLLASGENVGLPEGQFGNSEVGHLNIGAGRVVWQELSRIDKAIREGDFQRNQVLTDTLRRAASKGRLHVMGLVSDGGVHSHQRHLDALLDLARAHGVPQTYVHVFTDGRDTSPTSGLGFVGQLQERMTERRHGCIATIVGRYYAMDRDNRWERTAKAYNALVDGVGTPFESPQQAIQSSYDAGVTDEFITPFVRDADSRIRQGDTVIFFNIRGDRTRQIIKALFQIGELPFPTRPLDLDFTTFTAYDESFDRIVNVAFPPVDLRNTLGEVVSAAGLSQLRIAETEKYPHVTYFFNGGKETPLQGEVRVMVPSPKVATYDLQPEMSAPEVTDRFLENLSGGRFHLGVLNFANPDMVGHTGDMQATIKAVETVDAQLARIIPLALEHGYAVMIIADHGNADRLVQTDGSPHTAHTTAPVPALLVGRKDIASLDPGILADVAPTLLKLMGISQPAEMTGKPLF